MSLFSSRPVPAPAGPGQESVWDYPRPPRLEPTTRRLRVVLGGVTVADTARSEAPARRVLETSHPPTYYLPPTSVLDGALVPADGSSWCEWKGRAQFFTVHGGDRVAAHAAWAYASPNPAYAALRDHVAFYAGRMDACFVDDELVVAQPGDFYGGWITADVVGPFKGGPGSRGW